MNQGNTVATILANPAGQPLNDVEAGSVVDALQSQGAFVENVVWLSPNEACDIFFSGLSLEEARETLYYLLEPTPFDFAVQKSFNRKKSLLVSDMDSTMIEQECIDELAAFAGIKEQVAAITERAMNGELDFRRALKERVALLKGLGTEVLQQTYDNHISFMPGAHALTKTMRANGAKCVLVSGGFTFFTQRVANELGFHEQEANILETEDNQLTGKVKEPILDKTSKLNALKFHAEELGVDLSKTLVIGDGANDLDMICAAAEAGGLGVAYRAKRKVQEAALLAGGVIINHADLSGLLYVQGYGKEEIRL